MFHLTARIRRVAAGTSAVGYFSTDGAFYRRRTIFRVRHIFYSFLPSRRMISRVVARRQGSPCGEDEEIASDTSAISSHGQHGRVFRAREIPPTISTSRFRQPEFRPGAGDGARFAFVLHETLQNSK